MKLRRISIQNFRGINKFNWNLPSGEIFCLIGKGDSCKTTILEAIRCTFHPQWNHSFSDSDFHHCKVDIPIVIEILFGDLPDEFCSRKKYGAHLRGWNTESFVLNDEPMDDDEVVLSARLTVGRDLEPHWKIITDRSPEGVDFKATDRASANVGLIGSYSEKQLTWAVGSALARITEPEKLSESLVDATRAARGSLDGRRDVALKKFDAAAAISEVVAKSLGVPVDVSFKANLDAASVRIGVGGLTLHDGEMPLRQLGLGSRRMLLCGIQKENLEKRHVTLFDEVEIGLEPYRIARLIKHIKDDVSGQYFLTTHSPSALRELAVEHLYVVHKTVDEVKVVSTVGCNLKGLNIQGQLRSSAEAFLSTKIIVCEGATEVGFMRGLDNYWTGCNRNPFSYLGTVLLDAHGASKLKGLANGFKALNYHVCVVADGDAPGQFSTEDGKELEKNSVKLIVWAEKLALEQRAMLDLPWNSVILSVALAAEFGKPVHDNVRSKLNVNLDTDVMKWVESKELRRAIGDAAKSSEWFKSISKGESWVNVIVHALQDKEFQDTDLGKNIQKIRVWVDHG